MRPPKGRKDHRRPRLNYTTIHKAGQDPKQKTLIPKRYHMTITPNMEVKDKMKIPTAVIESGATKSGLQFIKASALVPPANPGETIEFTMNGDVEVTGIVNVPAVPATPTTQAAEAREDYSKALYSVPVSATRGSGKAETKLQGQYSLNKTSLKILTTKLGDETEKWIGARFTSFIGPTRNPRTQLQTLGFSILADSVHPAKSR